jgi:hypothetical protein
MRNGCKREITSFALRYLLSPHLNSQVNTIKIYFAVAIDGRKMCRNGAFISGGQVSERHRFLITKLYEIVSLTLWGWLLVSR